MLAAVLSVNTGSSAMAKDNIIQKEKMSFDRCLKVIVTSASKLSITPEIIDKEEKDRTAVFTLTDGTLTINCDGNLGLVIVSTSTN